MEIKLNLKKYVYHICVCLSYDSNYDSNIVGFKVPYLPL